MKMRKKQFYLSPKAIAFELKCQHLVCQSGYGNSSQDLFLNGEVNSRDDEGWTY